MHVYKKVHERQLDTFNEQIYLERDTGRLNLRYQLLRTRKETNEFNYDTLIRIPHMKEKMRCQYKY